jgi:hypothetical protein
MYGVEKKGGTGSALEEMDEIFSFCCVEGDVSVDGDVSCVRNLRLALYQRLCALTLYN